MAATGYPVAAFCVPGKVAPGTEMEVGARFQTC